MCDKIGKIVPITDRHVISKNPIVESIIRVCKNHIDILEKEQRRYDDPKPMICHVNAIKLEGVKDLYDYIKNIHVSQT